MPLFQSVNLDGKWSLLLPLNNLAQWILAFGDRH
ncbi:MAG: hypothetical protein ACI9LX_001187 [Paraglaciecola sp.]|jgi:hypothetical protein